MIYMATKLEEHERAHNPQKVVIAFMKRNGAKYEELNEPNLLQKRLLKKQERIYFGKTLFKASVREFT